MHEQPKSLIDASDLNPSTDQRLSRLDEKCAHPTTAFLLTGRPRMGKSTMVKKLVNTIGSQICGGFYTEEITNSGKRVGFRCVCVSRGESVEIANVESPSTIRIGRYGIDVNQFENFAIRVLEGALPVKKVIVIDEIGFMQMLSATFQKKIQEIFSRNHVVLGTVPVDSHPEIDKIKYAQQAKIIGLNEDNRDSITAVLAEDILRAVASNR